MKLAASNIAWNPNEESQILPLLKKFEVTGIELAPTKIWAAPTTEHVTTLKNYKEKKRKDGFEIPSLQAILFNHPELLIFGDKGKRKQTFDYILEMIKVAAMLGANVIVFGSPKNRAIGDLAYTKANTIAIEFFTKIAEACKVHDIYFCIEPNAKAYGADFLITTKATIKFLKSINHSHLKINLDSGNMILNEESPEESIDLAAGFLYHFQISEPNLLPLGQYEQFHKKIAKELQAIDYERWFSIEMRSDTTNSNVSALNNSIQFVKNIYEK